VDFVADDLANVHGDLDASIGITVGVPAVALPVPDDRSDDLGCIVVVGAVLDAHTRERLVYELLNGYGRHLAPVSYPEGLYFKLARVNTLSDDPDRLSRSGSLSDGCYSRMGC